MCLNIIWKTKIRNVDLTVNWGSKNINQKKSDQLAK